MKISDALRPSDETHQPLIAPFSKKAAAKKQQAFDSNKALC
jgi:hypothetical protein